MNSRGWLIGVLVSAALLTGCAATPGADTPSPSATASVTPTPTPTNATAAVDPAGYLLPPDEFGDGTKGVRFTAGGSALQCAIFDPVPGADTAYPSPHFGCEVSVEGYPYPPITGGLSDTANALVSRGHEKAAPLIVTDATFSGNTPAPALAAGTSLTWSTVTCTALAADEVRCVDATSGHGMRVSVRDYDLF
jgi:hypothetical protein